MDLSELAKALDDIDDVNYNDLVLIEDAIRMLRQQQTEITNLEIGLKNVWRVVESKEKAIETLEEQLADCTCQGGHSEAWLKAKGRLK